MTLTCKYLPLHRRPQLELGYLASHRSTVLLVLPNMELKAQGYMLRLTDQLLLLPTRSLFLKFTHVYLPKQCLNKQYKNQISSRKEASTPGVLCHELVLPQKMQ